MCSFVYDEGEHVVRSAQSVGHLQSITYTGGWWPRAFVQTDLGFYALRDAISLQHGEELVLQTRGNQCRYLCDAQQRCTQLL
jgi:hypothetical protein